MTPTLMVGRYRSKPCPADDIPLAGGVSEGKLVMDRGIRTLSAWRKHVNRHPPGIAARTLSLQRAKRGFRRAVSSDRDLSSALQGSPGVGTSLSKDLLGRKTSMTAPDHGTWTYVRNAFGELVSQTDAKQQITHEAIDRAGRLSRRDHYSASENPATTEPLDRADWLWIRGEWLFGVRESARRAPTRLGLSVRHWHHSAGPGCRDRMWLLARRE